MKSVRIIKLLNQAMSRTEFDLNDVYHHHLTMFQNDHRNIEIESHEFIVYDNVPYIKINYFLK